MNRRSIVGIIFIVAALLKLFDIWGIWHLEWLHQQMWSDYFVVFLIFYIGLELIIYGFHTNRDQWLQRPLPSAEDGKRIGCAVAFGGDEYIFHGECFHGARLDSFCGGIRMDMREAVITEDEEIDIHTFMGGVELIIPNTVNVVVKSRSFIGGVGNHTEKSMKANAPYLYIVASNMFGGVSIRNQEEKV